MENTFLKNRNKKIIKNIWPKNRNKRKKCILVKPENKAKKNKKHKKNWKCGVSIPVPLAC
jgi:hypothetical protein